MAAEPAIYAEDTVAAGASNAANGSSRSGMAVLTLLYWRARALPCWRGERREAAWAVEAAAWALRALDGKSNQREVNEAR